MLFKWKGPKDQQPQRHYKGDAGFDIVVAKPTICMPMAFTDIPSDVQVEMPSATWGMIIGRSSTLRTKKLIIMPGVIDNGWRGELFAQCWNTDRFPVMLDPGERVAQLIPFHLMAGLMELEHAETLNPGDRNHNGFGSTGT